jgi:hypothetical protein
MGEAAAVQGNQIQIAEAQSCPEPDGGTGYPPGVSAGASINLLCCCRQREDHSLGIMAQR